MRGLLKSVSKEDYVRYIIYIAEKTRQKINPKTGKRFTHLTMIIDMGQLSYFQISNKSCKSFKLASKLSCLVHANIFNALFSTIVAEAGLETTKSTEANYPESIRRVYLINGALLINNT
jgi:hypothetical protein